MAEAPDAGVRLTARPDHQTQPGAPSPGIAKGAPGGGPSSSAIATRYLRIFIRVLGFLGIYGNFVSFGPSIPLMHTRVLALTDSLTSALVLSRHSARSGAL